MSVANVREHWRKRAARARTHRATVSVVLRQATSKPLGRSLLPCTVTLTRIAPRELDGDNLQSSLKACRDGVADWLGVDDRDPRVTWRYDQRKGKPKFYAVEVSVE